MKIACILLLPALVASFATPSEAQVTIGSFKLFHNRTVNVISCDSGSYLQFTSFGCRSGAGECRRYLQGEILRITDSSVVLAPTVDYAKRTFNTDSTLVLKKSRKYSGPEVEIPFKNLEKISYQTSGSKTVQSMAFVTITFGAVITLVTAPLLSLNYKTGKMNTASYKTMASLGLGLITIGIPFAAIFHRRDYYMHQPKEGKMKKIWMFRN